jgi:hypothetical protein
LVTRRSPGHLAVAALVITVAAEISLSVLYATAWQPLLSHALASVDRQKINARVRAFGGALLAALVVVFAALGRTGRVCFLAGVAVVALGCAIGLRRVTAPQPEAAEAVANAGSTRQRLPHDVRRIYVVFCVLNLGSWPLVLVYVHQVLSPAASIGLVAVAQLGGALLAAFAWRPTASDVVTRARAAAVALVVAGFAVAALGTPVRHGAATAVMLATVFVGAGATALVRIALLELAHRTVDPTQTVRAFTFMDVIASTSQQVGLFFGGVLVTISASHSTWFVDPYRIYLAVFAVATIVAISRLPADAARTPPVG